MKTTTMKTTMKSLVGALATLLMLAGAAPLAAGQTALTSDGPEPVGDVGKAEALEREAEALVDFPHRWDEVVRLYREAADARPEGDPRASWDLRQAGRIAYYVGRPDRALRILHRAADTALEYGDVVSAANLYLDAAWVAQRQGQGDRAMELRTRAERLARSPLLNAEDGEALRDRIEPAREVTGQQ